MTGWLGMRFIELTPSLPDLCCDRKILLSRSYVFSTEPPAELFVDDVFDILRRGGVLEPRKDGANLWLIFVGV